MEIVQLINQILRWLQIMSNYLPDKSIFHIFFKLFNCYIDGICTQNTNWVNVFPRHGISIIYFFSSSKYFRENCIQISTIRTNKMNEQSINIIFEQSTIIIALNFTHIFQHSDWEWKSSYYVSKYHHDRQKYQFVGVRLWFDSLFILVYFDCW